MTFAPLPKDRRALMIEAIAYRIGITRQRIDRVVHECSDPVKIDPMSGPISTNEIFNGEPCLRKMVEFTPLVGMMSGRYFGTHMALHRNLPLTAARFLRWLAFIRETVCDVGPLRARKYFTPRAERIAQGLSMGIDDHQRDATTAPVIASSGVSL